MKQRIKEIITVLLIQLVLSIPFYSASVYAGIESISVKGNDGIEGYARNNDFLEFSVKASIEGDKVTNNQLILGSDIKFDKCTGAIDKGSECTLRFPDNGKENFDLRVFPFTVNLLRDDGTSEDSKAGSVAIDNKPPLVSISSEKEAFNLQEQVIVNYDVNDFACDDPSCEDKCVGIKSIELFTLDGKFRKTIKPEAGDEGKCTLSGSESIDSGIFANGMNSVFAKATDRFNQASQEESVTFDVDSKAPVINAKSFEISRKGIQLSTFSLNSVPVEVFLNISGDDLNLDSVTANLTELNNDESLTNIKAECSNSGDGTNVCKWLIELNPKSGGTKTIVVNASDLGGNSAGVRISRELSIDDKGLLVLSISTGNSLGKPSGNKITAEFDEATGISSDEVFLNVAGSKLAADSCIKESNWKCAWNEVNLGTAEKVKISIHPDSSDILLNHLSEPAVREIRIDAIPPVLRSINISPVGSGGLSSAIPGFFRIGDKIAVIANLTEENELSASADFSKFIRGQDNVAGKCERIQSDERRCVWDTDGIDTEAADVITFNFTDSGANSLVVTKPLRTFGVENSTTPDFWTNQVQCSPEKIDRTLGPLINLRVYCQIKLKQRALSQPVSTLFISPAQCASDKPLLEEGTETVNSEIGSTTPVIILTLKKDDFKIDDLNVSCSLNIFSKIGSSTKITSNPEIETAKINLKFFNLPLGELNDELKRKIDDAKKDTEGIWSIIGTLNKIVNIAKKICQLYETLYTIGSLLVGITSVVSGGSDAACASPFGILICPPFYSQKTATCINQQGHETQTDTGWKLAVNFCKFVNCKWAPWIFNDIKKWTTEQVDKIPGSKSIPGGYTQYLDPQNNLVYATLFGCLPGIIYNLDKYRQIKCLYADCLQNAVAREGVPITACEDQKAYATCKYVTGQVFNLIPPVAFIEHWLKILKQALSNPFGIIQLAVGAACGFTCPVPSPGATAAYTACEVSKYISKLGEVIGEVQSIINDGFTIREDYCSKLKDNNQKAPDNSTTITSGSGAAR